MARIRSIKPEFWTSEQVAACSPLARLLFVGLWTFCDDGGVHPASIKRLKMEVLPADAIDDATIAGLLAELVNASLVREYDADGERFWLVTGWHRHQRIDKPTFRHPRPPNVTATPTPIRRALGEDSSNARRAVADASPTEWSGVESNGIGVESERILSSPDGEFALVPPDEVLKSSKKRTRSKTEPPEPAVFPKELDTPEARQALEEWREHRRQKRNKLTPIQESKLLAEWAAKGSERFVAAVNRAIASGWSGIFEAEANGQRPTVANSQNDPRGNFAALAEYRRMKEAAEIGGHEHDSPVD